MGEGDGGPRRSKRARRAAPGAGDGDGLQRLVDAVAGGSGAGGARGGGVVVFSGAGLSVPSGMPTFVKSGGAYDRAARAMGLSPSEPGWKAFSYATYQKHPVEMAAFLADVWRQARGAEPSGAHVGLAELARGGHVRRHYTMNIDGLSLRAGERQLRLAGAGEGGEGVGEGTLYELHGSVRRVYCPECRTGRELTGRDAAEFSGRRGVRCGACGGGLRFGVVLYGDADAEGLSPASVFETMGECAGWRGAQTSGAAERRGPTGRLSAPPRRRRPRRAGHEGSRRCPVGRGELRAERVVRVLPEGVPGLLPARTPPRPGEPGPGRTVQPRHGRPRGGGRGSSDPARPAGRHCG